MYYEMIIIWTWRGYEKFSPSLGPKQKRARSFINHPQLSVTSARKLPLILYMKEHSPCSFTKTAFKHTHTHTQCKGGLFVSFLLFRLFLFSLLVIFFPPPDFLTGNSNLAENLYIEQLCRKSGGKLCNVMCPGKWAKADWQLDEYALVGLNVT